MTEIPNFECKTLVNFYIQTNGSDWEDASYNNWTIKNTPCQWLGITCRRGRVIGIKRNFQKLAGIIPNLSSLTHLEELDLSYNKLSSHVSNLITLTYLKKLNLSNNNLSGNIPNLSVLEHLKWFDMSNNEFNISFFNNFYQKVTSISNSQCQALILFYNNTNGKEWTDTPENLWGLTNMPCEWKGITCRDGNIISIERNSKGLKGFIHNLDGLSYLEEIYLYRNSITLKFPIANNLCKDVKKSICQNLVEMYIALIVDKNAIGDKITKDMLLAYHDNQIENLLKNNTYTTPNQPFGNSYNQWGNPNFPNNHQNYKSLGIPKYAQDQNFNPLDDFNFPNNRQSYNPFDTPNHATVQNVEPLDNDVAIKIPKNTLFSGQAELVLNIDLMSFCYSDSDKESSCTISNQNITKAVMSKVKHMHYEEIFGNTR